MKKTWLYALVVLIIVAVVGGSFFLFKKPQTDDTEKKEDVKISNSDVQNKLYPVLKSSNESKIYKKNKISKDNVTNEQMILGTITYIILNHESEIENGSKISFSTIEKYAEKLYGKKIEVKNAKVETIANIHSQSTFATMDKKAETYKLNFEFLEDDAKPKDLLGEYHDMDVIYDKVEVKDDKVVLYDKMIVNGEFDWSKEVATISKYDDSDKKELDKISSIDDVYKKYPEYFTNFKHTFKINEDKTYTYISSEPIA